MEENVFVNLAKTYFEFISDVVLHDRYICKGLTTSKRRNLFKKNKIKEDWFVVYKNKLSDNCLKIEELAKNSLLYIYQFAKFIRYAEKCFMYKNDESSFVYSEDGKDCTNIYFNFDVYKVKISFNQSTVPIMEELFPDPSNSKYLTFVKIEIVRNFGKKMKNEYKIILGDDSSFSDESDKILYQNIISKCIRVINRTNDSILNSIIPFYTGINEDYYKDELLDWRVIKDVGLYSISG